ncbi:SLAM family member 9-like [Pempheris klunzingeri]|uniref:SLAM family member 9-like n=1 Tax=Pempheris klunzingeri TaxID=3127111 RepID=UPI003980F36B
MKKDYLWTFGHLHPVTAIAIVIKGEVTHVNGTVFGNRLRTHVETGSITISNLTVADSGVFLLQVIAETGIVMQRFNLTVQDNSLIPLNVLEGDNVTLETGIEHLQKKHNVKWTRGPHFTGQLIAQWKNGSTFIKESYKSLLQLNPLDGSLIFIGVTKDYTDTYCVMMLLDSEPHILRQYSITVFDPVFVPHVNIATRSLNNGSCYINCCVENGPDVTLSWYRGQRRINQTSNPDIPTNLTLPLVIQHQGGVVYSCVAANPASTRAVTVNSTLWCPPQRPGPVASQWAIVVILVVVVVVLVALAAVISYLRSQREDEIPDSM